MLHHFTRTTADLTELVRKSEKLSHQLGEDRPNPYRQKMVHEIFDVNVSEVTNPHDHNVTNMQVLRHDRQINEVAQNSNIHDNQTYIHGIVEI